MKQGKIFHKEETFIFLKKRKRLLQKGIWQAGVIEHQQKYLTGHGGSYFEVTDSQPSAELYILPGQAVSGGARTQLHSRDGATRVGLRFQ